MKSLTESILSTSGAGIDASIKKWLEENEVIENNEYTIKNHIIYPKDDTSVTLFNRDYDELPEYIQFADGEYTLQLGDTDLYAPSKSLKEIKSFRGLPKNVALLIIDFNDKIKIPELNIKTGDLNIYNKGIYNKQNKLNITFDNKCVSKYISHHSKWAVGFVVFAYCTDVDIMDLQNCKFKGFYCIKIIDQHAKHFADIFNYINKHTDNIYKNHELPNQQIQQLEKLLKSTGFEDVTCIINSDWEMSKLSGTWNVWSA